MRLGVFLLAGRFPGQTDGDALRRGLAAVDAAEDAGLDDAWIAEHHFLPYGVCPSAITFAAHALGRSRRLSVGTAVSVLSTAHPVALAEQTALLDQLSGGRFTLGVGRGGPWIDLNVFDSSLERRDEGFPDDLDRLLATLTDRRVRAGGEDLPLVPSPATQPHPPVAVACTSDTTVDLAARRGLPMLLGMDIGDDDKAAKVARYNATAHNAGHDPTNTPHISVVVAHFADSRDKARRELRETMPAWYETSFAAYVTADGKRGLDRDPHAYADRLCDLHPVGTPAQCVERLQRSAERTGIHRFLAMVEGSGRQDRTVENIAVLGHEVRPQLQELLD